MFLTNLCLFLTFVFVVLSYEQFEDLNGLEDDVPKWIVIPENDNTCTLRAKQNYQLENHPLIVGKGTVAKPEGDYANLPRYYVKKRKLDDNQIQFVALLDPTATAKNLNEPNKFTRQLFALFCQQGKIDAMDPKTRLHGYRTAGKCGIEVLFVEFCLLDQDVGSLPDVNDIFEMEIPNMRTIDLNIITYQNMAEECDRFVGMKLPDRSTTFKSAVSNIGYFLKGAKKANFGNVLVQAFDIVGEACEAQHLCWADYTVDNLIGDTNLVEKLYRQSIVEGLPSVWYFCKDDADDDDDDDDNNPASRSTNLNRFHWLLIEYHQDSRRPNLKRVHG